MAGGTLPNGTRGLQMTFQRYETESQHRVGSVDPATGAQADPACQSIERGQRADERTLVTTLA